MRSFAKHAFNFSLAAVLTTGALGACAFYESAGRQAIEKDEGGLVTTSVNGFAGQPLHSYVCERSPNQPEYLKEPLEVIETEYESRGISVMTPAHTSNTPAWVAVHRHDEQAGAHTHCKVSPLQSSLNSPAATLAATRIGVDQVIALEATAARQ